MSTRVTIGSCMSWGSEPRRLDMALRTSLVTRSWSTPSSNSITVVEAPSTIVELVCRTWPSPAIESSIRRVTWVSSSLGAAPGRTAVTTTIGRSTSGLLLIRIERKPAIPAMVSSRNSRMTGIGFLIDQDEMLRIRASSASGSDGADAHQIALAQEARAIHDHLVAGGEAGGGDAVAGGGQDLDPAEVNLLGVVDHEHARTVLAVQHRGAGHDERRP